MFKVEEELVDLRNCHDDQEHGRHGRQGRIMAGQVKVLLLSEL